MSTRNITSIPDIEYQTTKKETNVLVDKIKIQKDRSSDNLGNGSNQQEKSKSSKYIHENLKQNDTNRIKSQRYRNIRRCFNVIITFTIKR